LLYDSMSLVCYMVLYHSGLAYYSHTTTYSQADTLLDAQALTHLVHTAVLYVNTTAGVFGSLFHRGEHAAHDAENQARGAVNDASRKAEELKRSGKNSAEDAADEAKGESPLSKLAL
jgi:hypothetical protein